MHRSRTSRKLVELFAILAIVLCVRALSGRAVGSDPEATARRRCG
jgi:hypothetical protein